MRAAGLEGYLDDDKPAAKKSGENLAQAVATSLEEDIVFGRLHPRERLVEEDLTERYQVKRHIIRQALVILERLGLVERIPNRGAVVRLYSVDEVEQINDVRELLESHAAELIPLPLLDADIELLESIQQRHAEAVETGDQRQVFRTNLAFHSTLFSLCGNQALVEAIKDFAQKSHAYRSIFVNDKAYLQWAANAHAAMVEALKKEDRPALIELCRNHLAPAKNRYIETYRSRFSR